MKQTQMDKNSPDTKMSDITASEDPSSRPRFLNLFKRSKHKRNEALRDAIEELVEENRETSFNADEKELLENVLSLGGRRIDDVMIPRIDIIAFNVDTPILDVIQTMSEQAHSRMPVYRDDLDDIIGMVHIKDLLACIAANLNNINQCKLEDIVREVPIVAPSMPILELLLQMRQSGQHMALVIDEFGGIDGLLTIEDLVEEIIGEIHDEHDEDEADQVNLKQDGSAIVSARLALEDLVELFDIELAEEEVAENDTVGGLIFYTAGRVPARGELLVHQSGLIFEILDANPRQIKRVKIKPPTPAEIHETKPAQEN